MKRYDDLGQRVTDCCGCYSTFCEGESGDCDVLCCKKCYHEVEFGEGDGSEFAEGVDPDEYYKEQHRRDEARTAVWVEETRQHTAEFITNLAAGGTDDPDTHFEQIPEMHAVYIAVTMHEDVWPVVRKYLSEDLQVEFDGHRSVA